MSDNRSRTGEVGGGFAASRPLSWSDRLRGALLGGAVGDVLGSGVRGWSLSAVRQWLGGRGVLDFLPVFGRRGAVSDLSQLTVFTMDALLRARATGEQDPLPVIRSNHLAWLHTQGVPWPYAMAGYWRSHPEPTGWLLRRPELFSTRNPGGNALRLLSTLVDRVPGDPGAHPAQDAPAGERAFADCLVWTAPLMVWSGDPRRVAGVASRVPRLLTTRYETRAAGALHADVLGGLLNGLPLWEAVRSWEVNRSHLENGTPPAAVLRAVHAAMFIAQQGQPPDPRMLDIEFCPSEGLGELGIAFSAVASAGNFTDAVITAVNHSADSAVAGALAGQLAGAVHGPEAIPGRWMAELELREVLETLAFDAAEAFAPPPPPRWARRYVAEGGRGRRELNSPDWTVEAGGGAFTGRAEEVGPAEEAPPPTQVLPAVVDDAEASGGRAEPSGGPEPAESTPVGDAAEPERAEPADAEPRGEVPFAGGVAAPWEREQTESSAPEGGEPGRLGSSPTAESGAESAEQHRESEPEETGQDTDRIMLVRTTSLSRPAGGEEVTAAGGGEVPAPSEGRSAPGGEGDEPASSSPGRIQGEEALPEDFGFAAAEPGEPPASEAVPEGAPEEEFAEEIHPRRDSARGEGGWESGSAESGTDSGDSAGEPEQEDSRQPRVQRGEGGEIFGVVTAPPGWHSAGESNGENGEPPRIKLPGIDELPPLPEHRPHRGAAETAPGAEDEQQAGSTAALGERSEDPVERARSRAEDTPLPITFEPFASVPYMESGAVERLVDGEEESQEQEPAPRAEEQPVAASAGTGGEHAVVEESTAEVPSATERILGCLLGSATGDALGAGLTEASAAEIVERYGPRGPTGLPEYAGTRGAATAATQTTLFTCEGLIRAREARSVRETDPFREVRLASQRWLYTQGVDWQWAVGELSVDHPAPDGWLVEEPELFAARSPGASVYAELEAFGERSGHADQSAPVDNSTGCGALVRATPAAFWSSEPAEVFELGVRIATLTHGHPSGYLPAGALAVIVQQVVLGRGLDDGVWLALQVLETWQGHEDTTAALAGAAELAASGPPGPEELGEQLGEGRRADEALGIAVCAALTAEDVRTALRTAVTHSGNSSAAGAVCGSIVGAALGVGALPVDWMAELELRGTVERMAMDCVAAFDSRLRPEESTADTTEGDSDWRRRYPVRPSDRVPESPLESRGVTDPELLAEEGADSWTALPERGETASSAEEETAAVQESAREPAGAFRGDPTSAWEEDDGPRQWQAPRSEERRGAFAEERPSRAEPSGRQEPEEPAERGGAAANSVVEERAEAVEPESFTEPGSFTEPEDITEGSAAAAAVPPEASSPEGVSADGAPPKGAPDGDARETNVLPVVTESLGDEPAEAEEEVAPGAAAQEDHPVAEEFGARERSDVEPPAAPDGRQDSAQPVAESAGPPAEGWHSGESEPMPAEERHPKPAPRRINSVSTGELDLTGEPTEK
ncbi:ADP-ribosylglycohydrolase family protein [Actinopolyspora saharensis]|uniref:ADP-ribosylglycohydrolase n=1 Tax=Actinopolyspora saharensis TaxID=995062 RepID=A0A1H1GIP6_9ACTN|nr:ADP-ribosylglycohydrolase family protein [Actinopolyspora saharensis]SDR13025.1 ADP-ribosylglycohydrolase [Actinopolyspora saharensis]